MNSPGARYKVQGVRKKGTGFSLIEVTVALGIIGVMLVAVGALLSRRPVDSREVRNQDLALTLVRSELETLRAGGYDALPTSGPFTHMLLPSLAGSSASVAVADFDAETKQVDVSVSWQGAGSVTRSVSLTTLVAQNGGLP